jgi:hypothetical protein
MNQSTDCKDVPVSITGEFCKGKIIVDGVDISKYVTGIEYSHDAGDIPRIRLQLAILDGVEIEAHARVVMDRYTPPDVDTP